MSGDTPTKAEAPQTQDSSQKQAQPQSKPQTDSIEERRTIPAILSSNIERSGSFAGTPDRIDVTVAYMSDADSGRELESTVVLRVDDENVAYVEEVTGDGTASEQFIPTSYVAKELGHLPSVSRVAGVPSFDAVVDQLGGNQPQIRGSQQPQMLEAKNGAEQEQEPQSPSSVGSSTGQQTPTKEQQKNGQSAGSKREQSESPPESEQKTTTGSEPEEESGSVVDPFDPPSDSNSKQPQEEPETETETETEPDTEPEDGSGSDEGVSEETPTIDSSDLLEDDDGWEVEQTVEEEDKILASIKNEELDSSMTIWDLRDDDGPIKYGVSYYSGGENTEKGAATKSEVLEIATEWKNNPPEVN